MNDLPEREKKEKRGVPRFPCSGEVSYMVMGRPGSPPEAVQRCGNLLDLSKGGIGMRTEGLTVEEGQVIQVWIPAMQPPVTFPVITMVRWVQEVRQGAYHLGLRFMA